MDWCVNFRLLVLVTKYMKIIDTRLHTKRKQLKGCNLFQTASEASHLVGVYLRNTLRRIFGFMGEFLCHTEAIDPFWYGRNIRMSGHCLKHPGLNHPCDDEQLRPSNMLHLSHPPTPFSIFFFFLNYKLGFVPTTSAKPHSMNGLETTVSNAPTPHISNTDGQLTR